MKAEVMRQRLAHAIAHFAAVPHFREGGTPDHVTVLAQDRKCDVRLDTSLPQDPNFRFYFIHVTGKRNPPPPLPLKVPRVLKVRVAQDLKLRNQPGAFNKVPTSLEHFAVAATIQEIGITHPAIFFFNLTVWGKSPRLQLVRVP